MTTEKKKIQTNDKTLRQGINHKGFFYQSRNLCELLNSPQSFFPF